MPFLCERYAVSLRRCFYPEAENAVYLVDYIK